MNFIYPQEGNNTPLFSKKKLLFLRASMKDPNEKL